MNSAHSHIKHKTLNALITRADGTEERVGFICYEHKNPLTALLPRKGFVDAAVKEYWQQTKFRRFVYRIKCAIRAITGG